jgi:dTDP-glucose 4,6-dehydratase
LKQNSILITGGAGFIGSEFARQAAKSDKFSRIFVLDSLTYAGSISRISAEIESNRIEFIQCDINSTIGYLSALSEVSFVAHFAAESHVDRSIQDGFPFLNSNVLGTYNLLNAVRSHPRIRTLLVSTDEVYGSIDSGEFTEESPLMPSSVYSASKTSSDLFGLAMIRTFNQDIVITRGCNTYGPHQDNEKLVPFCISRLLNGFKAPLYGDGQNVREWINVIDHAEAIARVLAYGQSGQIYNIGTGVRFSNIDLVNQIIEMLEVESDSIEFTTDRQGHDKRYALDSSKILSQLKWQPRIGFTDGLADTVSWYKQNLSQT